jgi:hypothetical protein
MQKIIREIGQFQLINDSVKNEYFIRNSITQESSYKFDDKRVETLLILDRYDFAQRCKQAAGNNLQKKIQ